MTAQAGDTTSFPSGALARRKAAARTAARDLRRALPLAERRRAARKAAASLARVCRARHVALYLGTAEEIDTAPLIEALLRQRCTLYVPKVAARGQLRFTRLRGALRPNRYAIAEPVALCRPARLDAVILPLVAFDAQGRRLGMGGGYYDRLLGRARPFRRPWRIGFAFAAQEVAAVPAGARDARLHAVATEHGLRRFA